MNSALSAGSVALYALATAMFFMLHARDSTVDWLRDPVSAYALGPAGSYFRLYVHVGTAAAALLAVQFALRSLPAVPPSTTISMFLLLAFRLGVALVPTDPAGQPTSARGRTHVLFAIATFAATYTAIANATAPLSEGTSALVSGCLSGLQVAAMLSLAAVVATMTPSLKRLFGMFERVFLLSTMLWFLIAGLRLLLFPSVV